MLAGSSKLGHSGLKYARRRAHASKPGNEGSQSEGLMSHSGIGCSYMAHTEHISEHKL